MHKYQVLGNQRLTDSTLLITLDRTKHVGKPFDFESGQYAAISFKRKGRPTAARCFSIVSSPSQPDILQFSVRTNGRYTSALNGLQKGDEVSVRGPFGGFVIDRERDLDTYLLAGGIGITPFMSMIRQTAATKSSRKLTLIYSCRSQDDVPFAQELTEIEKTNPNFRTIFVISDGPTDKFAGQRVASGRINGDIIDKATGSAYANKTFFICGPQAFMRGMANILNEKGVDHNRVMTEAFSQGPNQQTGKIKSWPFNIYALSALGLGLSSFVVMISDIVKTLPPSSLLGTSNIVSQQNLGNSRQSDLDTLVNALPDATITSPVSDAVKASTQTSSQASSTTATTVPQTTTTPAPVAAPKPKTCTTSSTGRVTCV